MNHYRELAEQLVTLTDGFEPYRMVRINHDIEIEQTLYNVRGSVFCSPKIIPSNDRDVPPENLTDYSWFIHGVERVEDSINIEFTAFELNRVKQFLP